MPGPAPISQTPARSPTRRRGGTRIDRIVSLVAAVLLLASAPVWGAPGSETTQRTEVRTTPLPAALAAKRRLDSEAKTPWRVVWNPKTGVVEEISGELDRSLGDSPKAAATAFLQEYGALFTGQDSTGKGHLPEFRYQRMSNKNPRRTSVKFLQYYQDIPVEAGVVVYVVESGHVSGARSGAIHVSDLSVTPTIGVEEAIELLRQRVAPKRLSASPDLSQGLRVVGHTDQPRLVYMIHAVSVEQCGPYTAYLDAHSGEVVSLTQDWADGPRDCDPFSNFDTHPAPPSPEPEIETPDEREDSSESLFAPPPRGEIYFNPLRPRDSGRVPIRLRWVEIRFHGGVGGSVRRRSHSKMIVLGGIPMLHSAILVGDVRRNSSHAPSATLRTIVRIRRDSSRSQRVAESECIRLLRVRSWRSTVTEFDSWIERNLTPPQADGAPGEIEG